MYIYIYAYIYTHTYIWKKYSAHYESGKYEKYFQEKPVNGEKPKDDLDVDIGQKML